MSVCMYVSLCADVHVCVRVSCVLSVGPTRLPREDGGREGFWRGRGEEEAFPISPLVHLVVARLGQRGPAFVCLMAFESGQGSYLL